MHHHGSGGRRDGGLEVRRLAKFALLLLFPVTVSAQTVVITGQVKDPNGVPYTNGRGRAILVPTNVFYTTGLTNPVPGSQSPVIIDGLDANGRFSVTLTSTAVIDQQTSNPQWLFTFCSAPILQFGPICFTGPILALTSSQDITAQISAVPPPVLPGGGTGGAPPSPPANVLQKASNPPVTFAASGETDDGTNLTVDRNMNIKGPNPWADITRFGARACVSNSAPCSSGITGTINSGSNSATLSAASTFVNGDGIVIFGAGASQSLTVPTGLAVSNVLAAAGTGTGLTASGAAGASTRCYKVIARDTGGGFTAASSEVCNSTSQSTLGAVTVNLSSCSRALTTVTCTTSSSTPLLVATHNGSEVYIGGSISDTTFRGWRDVDLVADSTHFTFVDTAINTGNGATTSSTGGTATFFVANHVSWTAVTGAWLYYIYEGSSGAETLIGVSRPQGFGGSGAGVTDTTFDDFGSSFTSNINFAAWIPTTPPTIGANDNLSTTIVSGAGTTTLQLFNTAGASVTNAGVRLDAAPAIKAAIAATGLVYIPTDPAGNSFVVNSFCDLTAFHLSMFESGTLTANETIAVLGQGMRWAGDRVTPGLGGGGGANTWGNYPRFFVNTAVPGLYINSGFGYSVEGINFQGTNPNGVLLVLAENGFNSSFKDSAFVTSTGNSDVMGFGLILRGVSAQSVDGIVMDKVSFSGGTGVDGGSHNTPFYCNKCGHLAIREAFLNGRGLIYAPNSFQGIGAVRIEDAHYNGGFTPLLSVNGPTLIRLGEPSMPIIMDTIGHPCVSSFSTNSTVSVQSNNCSPSGGTFVGPAITGGTSFANGGGTFLDSLVSSLSSFNAENGPANLLFNVTGPGGISVGYNNDSIFVDGAPPPAAPTCSVSAGGSVAIGSYTFFLQPVWGPNNTEGTPSGPSSACVTTTGNQTITVNWTNPPLFPKGNNIFVSGNGGGAATCAACANPFPVGTTSLVWSSGGTGAPNLNSTPLSGPTMLLPGSQGVAAPAYVTNGSGGFASTAAAATLSANRTATWPDGSGTVLFGSTAYLTSTYTNATTTFSNVSGLSFAVAANTNYKIRCDLAHSTSATTTGLKFQWTGPAAATTVDFEGVEYLSTSTFSAAGGTGFSTSTGLGSGTVITDLPLTLTLTLINGANAGTVQLQAAATGAGTLTILPGSCSLQQ